jgi:hypothetical protein
MDLSIFKLENGLEDLVEGVLEKLDMEDEEIYHILTSSENDERGDINLIIKISNMVIEKLTSDLTDEEEKNIISNYYDVICRNVVRSYLIRTSYKCFNSDKSEDTRISYLYYAILWLADCNNTDLAKYLSINLISNNQLLPILFINLFSGMVNMTNCESVMIDRMDDTFIIKTERNDRRGLGVYKHCDYMFELVTYTPSACNMFISQYN